jgi:asparagine synthase (glutamine-hydrolysing)
VFVNGMFAFILYDESNDFYVVARDPIGIIPLYVGCVNIFFVFNNS